VSTLKADNGELRAKLEESKQQLQSNEQMIRWLNQQVSTIAWLTLFTASLAVGRQVYSPLDHVNNVQLLIALDCERL
jgi:spindle assembly abnormal protein 6